MNTCKTCKWWEACSKDDQGHQGFCNNPKVAKENTFGPKEFGVSDCLGEWEATVGPDFGCIHHSP